MSDSKKSLSELSAMMKQDWDRRLDHDYRFWMSDGYENDEAMWSSGERDYEIITKGLEDCIAKTQLELGCGVGRLLRPALRKFRKVIGVDVSEKAINKAKDLLGERKELELIVGNGFDLSQIPDNTVDVALSFAAITSIPTDIIANYLREIHRVLKREGIFRLQCYLGTPQEVNHDDTLHIRCYAEDRFRAAMEASGFKIESIEELVLPFQVSFKDIGITAMIVSVTRETRAPKSAAEISKLLLPEGEAVTTDIVEEGNLETWMSLTYAKNLIKQGDLDKAEETIQFIANSTKTTAIDVQDLLQRVIAEVESETNTKISLPKKETVRNPRSGNAFEKNFSLIQEKFPHAAKVIKEHINSSQPEGIEFRNTEQGPSMFYQGQCLDHPTKPISGGQKWAERLLKQQAVLNAESILIYGFGSGIHVSELVKITDKKVIVHEPCVEVIRSACEKFDLSETLNKLSDLWIGKSIPELIPEDAELIIRPQTQAITPEVCIELRSKLYGVRGFKELNPKIGVLGPLMGGTLHMATSVGRSLVTLEQRVNMYDMKDFAGGYNNIGTFVKDDIRKKVVESNYVEMVSDVILQSIQEKPIDILIVMALAPISGRVLTELRQNGIITVHWFVEDYLRFHYWQHVSQYYDFMFTIQKGECLQAISSAGAGEVHYLPTAFDPLVHRPVSIPEEEKERWGSPISFVGAGYHNRVQSFAKLANFPFKIWGTEWPTQKPFDKLVQEEGRRLKPEEYIKIFQSSDINLNLHSSSERDGVDPYGDFINPRTFELAGVGAFQLSDNRSLLPEVFEADKEIATFSSRPEMIEKMNYYIDKPEERAKLAEASMKRAYREHTYAHRLKKMLSTIYASKYENLKTRLGSTPWNEMIKRSENHPELNDRCQRAFKRGEEPNLDGLVSDIVTGEGALSDTEKKLLFLAHIRKQIKRGREDGNGDKIAKLKNE